MSSFLVAVETVLEHEGGLTRDHAGPTNFGVTLPVLRQQGDLDGDGCVDGDLDQDGDVDGDDIRLLDPMIAAEVYQHQWWDRYHYEIVRDQALATKILDLSVNTGPKQTHRIVQRALRTGGVQVKVDGVLGKVESFPAINAAVPGELLTGIRGEAAGWYRLITEKRHAYRQCLLAAWPRCTKTEWQEIWGALFPRRPQALDLDDLDRFLPPFEKYLRGWLNRAYS